MNDTETVAGGPVMVIDVSSANVLGFYDTMTEAQEYADSLVEEGWNPDDLEVGPCRR